MKKLPLLAVLLGLAALPARAATDQDEIAALGEAFVKAFNQGDAGAAAACWTPDGDYTDIDGRTFQGRAAIEKMLSQFFAGEKGRTARIESESLRFPAPGLAVEDGTSFVFSAAGGPPSRARYTNVFAKKDGKWLLASVREAPFVAPDRSAELGGLSALLGRWETKTESGEALSISVAPAAGGNFLLIERTVVAGGVPVSGGTEWIGWDPAEKAVRSWSFEADGGFSESQWKPDGAKWTISSRGTLRDGRKFIESQQLSVGGDTLTLTPSDFTLDGKSLPAGKPLTFKRP